MVDMPDEALKKLLRDAQMRVTPVRLAVVRVLGSSPQALDAQSVMDRLSSASVDRVTVYRTLNTLVDKGVAHRVDPGDRVFRFGLTSHAHCTDELHDHSHPHLVCDECGTVECLEDAEVVLRRRGASDAGSREMKVGSADVTVHGTCEKCEPTSGEKNGARKATKK